MLNTYFLDLRDFLDFLDFSIDSIENRGFGASLIRTSVWGGLSKKNFKNLKKNLYSGHSKKTFNSQKKPLFSDTHMLPGGV